MTKENLEQFEINYQAGKNAFESGQYRLSLQYLETASQLVPYSSRRGGEVQMWLVTAYQASGMMAEALALCKQLTSHPHPEIRQKSKDILYIIEAPRLVRPQEWMSEIPDLTSLEPSDRTLQRGSAKINNNQPQPTDSTGVNTNDNQFITVALLLIVATLIGFIWLS